MEDVRGGDGDICKPPRSVICPTAIRELPGWAMAGHQHRGQDRQPHRRGLAPASLTLVRGRQTSRNRQMARSLWGGSPREQGLEQRVRCCVDPEESPQLWGPVRRRKGQEHSWDLGSVGAGQRCTCHGACLGRTEQALDSLAGVASVSHGPPGDTGPSGSPSVMRALSHGPCVSVSVLDKRYSSVVHTGSVSP